MAPPLGVTSSRGHPPSTSRGVAVVLATVFAGAALFAGAAPVCAPSGGGDQTTPHIATTASERRRSRSLFMKSCRSADLFREFEATRAARERELDPRRVRRFFPQRGQVQEGFWR